MTELLIIFALIAINGVFAGAEIALVSVRKTRLQELVDDGHRAAQAAAELRSKPERLLATVQIGITVVGASAAAFGGSSVAQRLTGPIASIPYLEPYAGEIAFALVIGGISYLSLVFGELVPKSLGLRFSEGYALAVSRPLKLLAQLARPAVWLLTSTSNIVLKPFGDRTDFTESRMSADELRQLIEEAGKAGALDDTSREITTRAISFGELTAADVMVPRSRVIAVEESADPETVRGLYAKHGHTRLPVYRERLDNVVGYVTTKDLLSARPEEGMPPLTEVLRPGQFVPESARAVDVLRQLQRARSHLAMVVDEHGVILGIVTLEDLVEELVGEIFGEHETPPELIHKETDGSAVVHGYTPVRDVNRALGLDLSDEHAATIAGLCIHYAGRIPTTGEKLSIDGVHVEVLDASPRQVRTVRMLAPPAGVSGE